MVGLRPDQRLSRSGSATSPSGAVATTPTCRRSRGSTPATPRTPCGWPCASRGRTDPRDPLLTRMRIWLPDAPGVLGAVAAEIGAVKGNVVGLEVLEREAGVAIDELVVELPDEAGASTPSAAGCATSPGPGSKRSRSSHEVHDREDTVLTAAAAILQAATPTAAMNALSGRSSRSSTCPGWPLADHALGAVRRGARRRPVGAVGGGLRRGVAQRRRPGQRHHRLGRLRRAGARDRADRVRGAAGRPSGAASAMRSPCSSWWRRASSTPWLRGASALALSAVRPLTLSRRLPNVPPWCGSASSGQVSSLGPTGWASKR